VGGRERREADCRRVFRGFRRQRRRCNAPSQRDIGETPHNVCHEVNIEKLRSAWAQARRARLGRQGAYRLSSQGRGNLEHQLFRGVLHADIRQIREGLRPLLRQVPQGTRHLRKGAGERAVPARHPLSGKLLPLRADRSFLIQGAGAAAPDGAQHPHQGLLREKGVPV